jgi:hypothetical protein
LKLSDSGNFFNRNCLAANFGVGLLSKKKYYLIKYPNNGIAETGNFFNRHCVTAISGVGSLPQKRTLYWIILEIWNYSIGRTGRKRTSYCQEESQTLGTKGVQSSLCISKVLNY